MTPARAINIIALALVAGIGSPPRSAFAANAGETCMTAQCHAKMTQGATVHQPVKSGHCGECHARRFGEPGVPHVAGQMTVPAATPELCLRCHADIKKQRDQSHQHRPVARLTCGFCHVPHNSSLPHLLRSFRKLQPKDPFCYLCHDRRAFRGKVVHEALDDGCSTCHQVHGSASERLLRGSLTDVCGNCHDVAGEGAKVVHDPVSEGSCTECHRPHAADREKLLKLPPPTLCLKCHDQGDLKEAHQSLKTDTTACLNCHVPHASKKAHLLK